MRAGEDRMKPQILTTKTNFFSGEKTKAKAILWNLSSEMIDVYLWFLKFSNILLKLIQ